MKEKIINKKILIVFILLIAFVFLFSSGKTYARTISFNLKDGAISIIKDNIEEEKPDNGNNNGNDNENNNGSEEKPDKDDDIVEEGAYVISCAADNNFVFDISGPSTDDKAPLHIWKRTEAPNQKFYITYEGDNYYRIASINSAKVLDIPGASKEKGEQLQQYGNNDTAAQRFEIIKNEDGTYSFIAKCSGLAVDVDGGIYENGRMVQQYEINGTTAQKFNLEKTELINDNVNGGIISIKTAKNPKMQMDMINCSNEEGNKVHLWAKASTLAQRFEMKRVGENEIRIRTAASGGFLKGSNSEKGADVVQIGNSKTEASDSDTWKVEWDEGIILVNKETGLVLTINGDINTNGTEVKLMDRANDDTQRLLINTEYLIPEGLYCIESKYGTMLDVKSNNQGTPLQTWSSTGTSRQVFKIEYLSDGYKIKQETTGYVLDVQSGSMLNAATVQMEIDAGTRSQRWIPELQDGGYIVFKNVNSGMVLNVHLANKEPGAIVNQGRQDNGSPQLWKLIPTELDEFTNAWGDDWCTDKVYLAGVIDRANRVGSDTDWFIAIDVRNFRMTLLHRMSGKWYVDACFNATMGYLGNNGLSHTGLSDQNGKLETNWTVTRKIPNRSGDIWFVIYIDYTRPDGSDNSQGIHNHYELAGQSYSSHGCPRLTDERAKYVYDNVAIGSRVHIWHNY